MLNNLDISLIIIIVLIASTIRSAFGFGDALIAMPLLAFFISIKTATPFVAMIGLTISIIILAKNWKTAYTQGLWVLILFCFLGVPIGVFALKYLDESYVKLILSIIIVLSSTFNLLKPNLISIKSNNLVWIFGLISGFLGGAYNTNGPPVIIYGRLKGWNPLNFRAILQTVFLPTNLIIIASQGVGGFWSKEVIYYYLISLPAIIIGTIAGSFIVKRINSQKYMAVIDLLLIFIGSLLFITTIFKF